MSAAFSEPPALDRQGWWLFLSCRRRDGRKEALQEKSKKDFQKDVDKRGNIGYNNIRSDSELHARVVELADSLDSGSSVHYARAGSSPASRTKANGDTVFEKCCITIRFLLLQANRGCGQHNLIFYGNQADTELLQTLHIHIGVQAVAA